MKAPAPELLELCGAVRDETATPEQIERLEGLLAADADARRFYRQFTQIGAMLERYERAPAPAPVSPISPAPAAPAQAGSRWRPPFWLALAACFVVLLAVYLSRRPSPRHEAGMAALADAAADPIGYVQEARHCTVMPRVGASMELTGSYALRDGDILATTAQGNAVLRFPGEGTLFILTAQSRAWLSREGPTKIIHLTSGQIYGDVTPQRDGAQWRILTSDGEAKVLGTQLAVTAAAAGTRVAVTSGLVRVTARDSRQSVETPAGYAADLTPTTATLVKLAPTEPTRVASFALIDADTLRPLQAPLTDGAVIDLAALPTRRLNIQANCEPKLVGAVRFTVTAVDAQGAALALEPPAEVTRFRDMLPNQVEIYYPYMLAGDPSFEGQPLPNRAFGWTPPAGRYTLTATPYATIKNSGAKGASLTIHFEVVDRVAR